MVLLLLVHFLETQNQVLLLLCLIAGIVFIILEKVGYLINHYYPNDYSIDSLSKDKIFLTLLTPVLLLINFLLLPLGLGEGGPYGHEGQQSGDSTALVILFTIFSFLYFRKGTIDWNERFFVAIGWVAMTEILATLLVEPMYGLHWTTMMNWQAIVSLWIPIVAILSAGLLQKIIANK